MPRYEITKFFSNSGSRNEIRMRVVNALQLKLRELETERMPPDTFIM